MEVCDVLVVDVDEPSRDALRGTLTSAGYSVASCTDGERALLWLRTSGRPRLLLLDLTDPATGALALREAMLRDAELLDLPLLVVSAGEELPERFTGVERLPRPVDATALLASVEEHCGPR